VDLGLEGTVALVTAAGSGIGLATAAAFAKEGSVVVALDRDVTALADLGGVEAVAVDLLDPAVPKQVADDTVGRHGRIDVLVNGLGGVFDHPGGFHRITDEEWQRALELNFLSLVRMTRAVIPHMLAAGRGSIVSIASNVGREPTPIFVDYSAAKAAIISLSKSLSIEYAPHRIRSNVVSPGPTRTPGFVDFFRDVIAPVQQLDTEAAIDWFVRDITRMPTGRLGEPDEVANVILFLASDLAAQVTGSEYCVNGGVIQSA
jgi:NAD(P)-dependent dehydrogenase (short-subunit alcohol dehydrogenase family)